MARSDNSTFNGQLDLKGVYLVVAFNWFIHVQPPTSGWWSNLTICLFKVCNQPTNHFGVRRFGPIDWGQRRMPPLKAFRRNWMKHLQQRLPRSGLRRWYWWSQLRDRLLLWDLIKMLLPHGRPSHCSLLYKRNTIEACWIRHLASSASECSVEFHFTMY